MKLIIDFKRGEYSPLKDEFKKIFKGKFKWDNKQAWVSKEGYVKASKKMETGEAVTFLIECDEKMREKFANMCAQFKVSLRDVQSFDDISIIEVKEEAVIENRIDFKLDRASVFLASVEKKKLSKGFVERWSELLRADDEKYNLRGLREEAKTEIDELLI